MNRLAFAVAVVALGVWISIFTSGPLWAQPQSQDGKDQSQKSLQTNGQGDRQGKDGRIGKDKKARGQQSGKSRQDQDRGRGHGKSQQDFNQKRKAAARTKSASVGKSQPGRGKMAGHHFDDGARNAVRRYYSERLRSGHCPPGLVRNGRRCQPPRGSRKWTIGKQLSRGVIFYDLAPQVIEVLGPPPPKHRYVRVANDILLITTGIGMVVDAIEDLQALQ